MLLISRAGATLLPLETCTHISRSFGLLVSEGYTRLAQSCPGSPILTTSLLEHQNHRGGTLLEREHHAGRHLGTHTKTLLSDTVLDCRWADRLRRVQNRSGQRWGSDWRSYRRRGWCVGRSGHLRDRVADRCGGRSRSRSGHLSARSQSRRAALAWGHRSKEPGRAAGASPAGDPPTVA